MLFSRKRKASLDPVGDFWAWWPTVHPEIESAIGGQGDWGGPTDQMNKRVREIHSDLHWEFAKGSAARHSLVVTAAGDPALRAVAARWLAAAPPADDTWEFHDSRQPDPDNLQHRMQIEGVDLALADLVFSFEQQPHRIDVTGHHPRFGELPDEVRGQVTFLTLDWLLGEDAVALWIGAVEWTVERPTGAAHPHELRDAVARLAAEHDEPSWALLTGETPDGRLVSAVATLPLRSIRWPRFDTHLAVVAPYRLAEDGQRPASGEFDALNEFTDAIEGQLGGDGALVAHESSRGIRRVHLYIDGATDAADRVRQFATQRKGTTVRIDYDPALEAVQHLAG